MIDNTRHNCIFTTFNRYTIVAADHDNYGVEVPNGTWTGMIGQILRQVHGFKSICVTIMTNLVFT